MSAAKPAGSGCGSFLPPKELIDPQRMRVEDLREWGQGYMTIRQDSKASELSEET